jgi:hypothetical protein
MLAFANNSSRVYPFAVDLWVEFCTLRIPGLAITMNLSARREVMTFANE